MAFGISLLRPPAGLMITVFGARSRTLRLGRWGTILVGAVVPLVGAWYLAATLYLVFHDDLLASLMAHQMDMQYSYEDRIAQLRSQLDRETSRGLIDRRALDTTLRDLAVKGDQLATRAAAIDALLAEGLSASDVGSRSIAGLGGRNLPLEPPRGALPGGLDAIGSIGSIGTSAPSISGDLRTGGSLDGGPSDADLPSKRSELSPGREDVAALYARVERAQTAAVARLRAPLEQSVARMASALAQTGLPTHRWLPEAGDVGGPFVPLPPGATGFEADVALLRDAARERKRLALVVERVPLRRPLSGPLEVTSTFGARLDPFFGRPAMHTGIDLREDRGDAVESTAAGVVTIAGTEGGYGNMVEIDHGNGLSTRYAHLSAITVVPHQMVPAGFVVGRVGSTGRSTGPHLHYETRIDGEPVDPSRFLRAGSGLFPG